MQRKYDICALCVIGVLTFLLVFGFSLTETNFSVIGNREGRKALLLAWGALVGNYGYLYMDTLMKRAECTDLWVRTFLLASLFLLIAGVGIPYWPKKLPRLSRLHVMISFSAPVCMAIAQLRFLLLMQKRTGTIWKLQWGMQLVLGAGSVILFFSLGMVSSLLEIFVTFSVCLYLLLLDHRLEKISDNL